MTDAEASGVTTWVNIVFVFYEQNPVSSFIVVIDLVCDLWAKSFFFFFFTN